MYGDIRWLVTQAPFLLHLTIPAVSIHQSKLVLHLAGLQLVPQLVDEAGEARPQRRGVHVARQPWQLRPRRHLQFKRSGTLAKCYSLLGMNILVWPDSCSCARDAHQPRRLPYLQWHL